MKPLIFFLMTIFLISVNSILEPDMDFLNEEKLNQNKEQVDGFISQLREETRACVRKCVSECSPKSQRTDMGLNCLVPCIEICTPRYNLEAISESQRIFETKLQNIPKFYCTNGLDLTDAPLKVRLFEFARGPCSPLVIVPGVTATKLVIQIDCKVFREKERQIFDSCGWTDCEKTYQQFWRNVPDSEYFLWIPSITSPLSILTFSEKSNLCFANLIKPRFNLDKPVEDMFEPRDGVKIKIYGFTEKTSSSGNCGSRAIESLLPTSFQTMASEGFGPMQKIFTYLGYVSGLTFQAIPYNFYYSYKKNEFLHNFKNNVKRLNDLTGKKITILAHSMGNLNVLHNLSKMTKAEKKALIFNWISIGPPFLGTAKTQKTLISGNGDYITLGGYFGFHFDAFAKTTTNQMSLYELSAKDPFALYSGQQWFDKIKQRIKYENEFPNIPFENSGISFWPPKDAVCHEAGKEALNVGCTIDVFDTTNEPMMQIGNQTYTIKDTTKLLEDFHLNPRSSLLNEKLNTDDLTSTNPEVPVILIYTASIMTPKFFQFASNFKDAVNRKIYPKTTNIKYTSGDMTVPTYSALLPALKWAIEFQDKPDPNIDYQPVKFIEYCGIGFSFSSVYDKTSHNGPYEILKNDYKGLNCDCNFKDKKSNYEDCQHSHMHADSNMLKVLFEVIVSNQRASKQALDKILSMDEDILEENLKKCDHIKGSIFHD